MFFLTFVGAVFRGEAGPVAVVVVAVANVVLRKRYLQMEGEEFLRQDGPNFSLSATGKANFLQIF